MTLQKDPEGNETKYLQVLVDFTNQRALEIGCGEGRLTWRYAAPTRWTVGIDPDEDSLRVATMERPADLLGKAFFTRASTLHLPFRKESFDIAVLAWSL
jgi:ubiquinone/menaquinone biosynthesis C-methylase UbiE